MIEQLSADLLANYGVLGGMCVLLLSAVVYMVKKEERMHNRLIEIINNNTQALTRMYETIRGCDHRRR